MNHIAHEVETGDQKRVFSRINNAELIYVLLDNMCDDIVDYKIVFEFDEIKLATKIENYK